MSIDMASELYELVKLVEEGPPRPTRADKENLRCAAIVHNMINMWKVPQSQALQAVFGKRHTAELETLARNYRNWLLLLPETYSLDSKSANEMLLAYYRTDSCKQKKRKGGKLKGK